MIILSININEFYLLQILPRDATLKLSKCGSRRLQCLAIDLTIDIWDMITNCSYKQNNETNTLLWLSSSYIHAHTSNYFVLLTRIEVYLQKGMYVDESRTITAHSSSTILRNQLATLNDYKSKSITIIIDQIAKTAFNRENLPTSMTLIRLWIVQTVAATPLLYSLYDNERIPFDNICSTCLKRMYFRHLFKTSRKLYISKKRVTATTC